MNVFKVELKSVLVFKNKLVLDMVCASEAGSMLVVDIAVTAILCVGFCRTPSAHCWSGQTDRTYSGSGPIKQADSLTGTVVD